MHHDLSCELLSARGTRERSCGEVLQDTVHVAFHEVAGASLEVVIELRTTVGAVHIYGVTPARACHRFIVLKAGH